jgi:hypothetical protein
MRIFGFVMASVAAFAFWGLLLVLSGGVAPLGRAGAGEGATVFAPIVLFVLPLAVLAMANGHVLAGTWSLALAPLLGAANFALAVSSRLAQPAVPAVVDPPPPTFALVWLGLLALVLAGVAGTRWIAAKARAPSR